MQPYPYYNPNQPYTVGAAYSTPNQSYGYQMTPGVPQREYMINVDGEVGARAWQMPQGLPPNTVIPLFDFDGQHVYFRSVDMYGRPNPIRKGRIVFEEDAPRISEASGNSTDMSGYATKEDFEALKADIRQMLQKPMNRGQSNQNGGGRNE